jgi:hypothetical protein
MRSIWMGLWLAGLVVFFPMVVTAEDKPVAESIGEAGRAVVEGSKSAYRKGKALAVETGHAIAEDSKEAYQEAKQAGAQATEDVKRGFHGPPAAPPAAGKSAETGGSD